MLPPTSAPIPEDDPQYWTNYYQASLRQQLLRKTVFVQNHQHQILDIKKHVNSLVTLIQESRPYPALFENALTLIDSIHPWPIRWGLLQTWEEPLRFAVQICTQSPFQEHKARFLVHLSDLLITSSNLDEAEQITQQALALTHHSGDLLIHSRAVANLAYILSNQGRTRQSHELVDRACAAVETSATLTSGQRALALGYLCASRLEIFRRNAQLEQGIDHATRVINDLQSLPQPDERLIADTLEGRAILYWASADYPAAIHDLETAGRLYRKLWDDLGYASIQANLGLVYWSTSQYGLAESAQRQAISFTERVHARSYLMRQVGDLGMTCFSQGKMDEAVQYISHQFEMAQQAGDTTIMTLARGNLAAVGLYLGQYASILPDLEQSVIDFEKQERIEPLIGACLDLSMCYRGLGDLSKALALAQKAQSLAEQKDFAALKVICLRCLALFGPAQERIALLKNALEQAQKLGRKSDEIGCTLSLAALVPDPHERMRLWENGRRQLEEIGATAWLDGHDPEHPPFLPLSA